MVYNQYFNGTIVIELLNHLQSSDNAEFAFDFKDRPSQRMRMLSHPVLTSDYYLEYQQLVEYNKYCNIQYLMDDTLNFRIVKLY